MPGMPGYSRPYDIGIFNTLDNFSRSAELKRSRLSENLVLQPYLVELR
jgi:hypothetical protein